MVLITSLEPERGPGGRFLLEIDGEPLGVVPEDVVARHGLVTGLTLTPERLSDIRSEAAESLAMDTAVRYLSHRPRTRAEVVRHLRSRGHSDEADLVVRRCERLGYVDDGAYSVAFARERIRLRPRGRARVVSELLARGVGRETAERAVERAFTEEDVTDEDLLAAVARRRAAALQGVDRAPARRRLTAYLLRRGFGHPAVRAVVDRLLPGQSDRPPS